MAKATAPEEVVETEELSDKVIATRDAIRDRPRQSVTRYVEYFNIIKELVPERLEEFFTTEEIDAIEAVADQVKNPVVEFRAKSDIAQLELAEKALTNEDEKNGYAGYSFDAEVFADRTKPKAPRTKKTVEQKVDDLLSKITPEEQATLQALLQARGLGV